MMVAGVGHVQWTFFVPVETLQQQEALRRFKKELVEVFGGVTELNALGYWNPPQGIASVETVKVLVAITTTAVSVAAVHALAAEYQKYSGEQQVLFTKNNLDVFYINKEQE